MTIAIFAWAELRDGGDPTGQRAVWDQRCCFDCRDYTASNDREDDLVYTEEI